MNIITQQAAQHIAPIKLGLILFMSLYLYYLFILYNFFNDFHDFTLGLVGLGHEPVGF